MYGPSYGGGFAPPAPYLQNAQGQPQQQQQQQHQQSLMYNPQQQYGTGPPGPHQSPYNAPPGMGGNGAMMQNTGLAHTPGNAAGHAGSPYQTPYTSSPYGASIPTSTATSLPPQYIPNASSASAFQMNMPNMQQRMQPPNNSNPQQRASPYGGPSHNTPPNANANQQSQFSTPQASNHAPHQTPSNHQQQGAGGVVTPQTPSFPPGAQGLGSAAGPLATPLSPGSEIREKERVTLLLEINTELVKVLMQLQGRQKEITAHASSPDTATAGEKEAIDKEKVEKEKASLLREYTEYLRRLQCNLAYLAAIADRSHKPLSQIPPHPAIISCPPPLKSSPNSPAKPEGNVDNSDSKEDLDSIIKDQYERLQALFPGVDPKREPPLQTAKKPQPPPGQGQGQGQEQNQQMLKAQMQQRMVQEQQAKQQQQIQQAQAHAQAQAQAQGTPGR
ncbi:hypothetical protein BP5796_01289 [Coleophoma crateriformis]|uniref:Uncharacterized protein n=1 Tax=Coleophoma crateriformis TaxID=565419 RepID=A0A3D8T003_9HELO|nr:hypothetical protein BP5796_01289 [Coleophoma crateriformis]